MQYQRSKKNARPNRPKSSSPITNHYQQWSPFLLQLSNPQTSTSFKTLNSGFSSNNASSTVVTGFSFNSGPFINSAIHFVLALCPKEIGLQQWSLHNVDVNGGFGCQNPSFQAKRTLTNRKPPNTSTNLNESLSTVEPNTSFNSPQPRMVRSKTLNRIENPQIV
ncbi:hypothetical protein Scep_026010 [Stephania cephalantha]|uniref:Uncharacterized protein n=1 Tax=Stephania cephalantha TaxID=152367 RepID=A0AAP0EJC2_9MAGN